MVGTRIMTVSGSLPATVAGMIASSALPPTALTPDAHYERVIEAFGGDGYYASTPDEVRSAMRNAVSNRRPALVNIVIDPQAVRQGHDPQLEKAVELVLAELQKNPPKVAQRRSMLRRFSR